MITGNSAMPRITGNMNRPSGPTIFTGSWLARSSARINRRSRMSSLKTRKASPTSVPSSIDWRNMAARERASSSPSRSASEASASIVLRPARISAPIICKLAPRWRFCRQTSPLMLAAERVTGGLEAKPGADTDDQKIKRVGKSDPIALVQYPFAARDVGVGPRHCEENDNSRQTELQVPFAIDHKLFGDEDRDRKNDDGHHARKDVVVDGINAKK